VIISLIICDCLSTVTSHASFHIIITASRITSTDSILRLIDEVYGGAVKDITEGQDLLESLK
jgi:hypothetical protein